ncbi:ATP-binding protein [Actinomadura rupiterrae]|uniref:ATP-binding protein n=1 Tax=Actinomadura rupiterrae TaxID=559627 RepID=UPI0020A5D289|nr:ATP-binding protein [Actinomadura rupiterrae]MCP2339767.1 anti-sigma regulatory factor (Ser/Thr protein kinase) [Actinomadura rupiterrae]
MADAEIVVEACGESIKVVRDFVGEWFGARGYASELVYVARTVASELVTNALLHGSDPGDPITVRLLLSDAGPVIEVEDGSEVRPVVRPLALDALSGRGLAMIELMTRAWGVRPRAGGGKVVFAVLDVG